VNRDQLFARTPRVGKSPIDLAAEALVAQTQHGFLLSTLQSLLAWGRKNSLWPFGFGLSCCFIEYAAALTSRHDIARFGQEVLRGTPREADVMIVAGTPFIKCATMIRRLYEQMLEPRWVISMGSCSNSGGMYDIYSVVQGVDKIIPVDVYVPGCPPRPEALMEGLLLLREKVGKERRPLSWVAGPQEPLPPVTPCLRDLKLDARRQMTTLPSPEEIEARTPPLFAGKEKESAPDSIRGKREESGLGGSAPLREPHAVIRDSQFPIRNSPIDALQTCLGDGKVSIQTTADGIPTVWVAADDAAKALRFLKHDAPGPYPLLYDLTAIDERERRHRADQPAGDFTVVYHLLSFERNDDIRVKVALRGDPPKIPSIVDLWPNANWYEREAWDMFGVVFEGHPQLRRILSPPWWEGHPLRREHPARATEMGPFSMPDDVWMKYEDALRFRPEEWGLREPNEESDTMILNLGPQHLGTHGVLRVVLQLDGEEVVAAVPDIGFHHRGAEKMAERQTWHSYIPYTDRIDYLAGAANNLPYLLAVEKLAGIQAPPRAETIRVLLAELFRIESHLVWFGTQAQDIGSLSPLFYMFNDREKIFGIVEAICGGRMHPMWFRIGGVAQDLPNGWERLVDEFLNYLPRRLREYDDVVMRNGIFQARAKGVGRYTQAEAIDWGVTGPGLRATGLAWDFRKKRPYSGYENFEFDVPTAQAGDVFARCEVRLAEIRQSLRIVEQCRKNMPAGPYKSAHALATPPIKDRTMQDIETLITHFLQVAWGPVIPPGEAFVGVEGTKGGNGYYLVSDGDNHAYRCRIRTPSFAHVQMLPRLCQGALVSDVLAILGGIDYVLADVDR
jgi:NADH-quinone oxidoreductase subunit C/D